MRKQAAIPSTILLSNREQFEWNGTVQTFYIELHPEVQGLKSMKTRVFELIESAMQHVLRRQEASVAKYCQSVQNRHIAISRFTNKHNVLTLD